MPDLYCIYQQFLLSLVKPLWMQPLVLFTVPVAARININGLTLCLFIVLFIEVIPAGITSLNSAMDGQRIQLKTLDQYEHMNPMTAHNYI